MNNPGGAALTIVTAAGANHPPAAASMRIGFPISLEMSAMNDKTSRARWPLLAAAALALAACGGGKDSPPPAAKGDPLYEYQWHLKNTGQASFSSAVGTPGIDLNAEGLLQAGVAGSGVKVLVLDDGIDIRHEDLAANVDHSMLRNFDPKAPNPGDPMPLGIGDAHGIAVAGIIGAAANNGVGGRGIAPSASLGSINFLCDDCKSLPNLLAAYGGAPYSQGAWVINASYGSEPAAPEEVDIDTHPGARAIRGFADMRGGKGTVMIKSAGNEFSNFELEDGEWSDQCDAAQWHGLSCQNAAFDPESAMPQVVTVGAVNARGVKSSYSTAGSNLLLAGLGGEYGMANPGTPDSAGPALVTTDLAGCERGYARNGNTPYKNAFEDPASQLARQFNPRCDYTSAMNGTSAAAPTVSGVVALMLGANPNLTWRDLRLILAKTARKIDGGRPAKVLTLTHGDYVAADAWITNQAGLSFHNWYGYGLVDAAAAVALAKTYTNYLSGPIGDSGWLPASMDPDGLELTIPLENPDAPATHIDYAAAHTIEAVQVMVSIDGNAILGDLGIELISPQGTRSVLMNAHNAFQKSRTANNLLLMSNAFNQEKANGKWTLRVVDVNGRRSGGGDEAILANWALRVYGR